MQRQPLVKGEFYHIYGRGVDKRPIFKTDRDRIRFIHTLYILNNFLEIPHRFDLITLSPRELLTPIEPYVDIVAGCLMHNHYHLMLTQRKKDGISKFFQKVGTSYTMYFNKLHERSGRLFESTFRSKHVDRNEYAVYLTQYIHLNPMDLFQVKPGTSNNLFRKIEEYPWSTLPDYVGEKSRFSILISLDFRNAVLDMTAEDYRNFLKELYADLY